MENKVYKKVLIGVIIATLVIFISTICIVNHKEDQTLKILSKKDSTLNTESGNEVTVTLDYNDGTGKKESAKKAPENFYHGFVLGLMVDQTENYLIISNRESGYGRYDIMLEPIDKSNEKLPGIVIEFKVINPKKETTLKDTVEAALEQIEEKKYDAELIKRGVKLENIRHYGFAFKGKEVLIESGKLPQSVWNGIGMSPVGWEIL